MEVNERDLEKLQEYAPELINLFMLFHNVNIATAKNIYTEIRRVVQDIDDSQKLTNAEVIELRRQVGQLMTEVMVLKMQLEEKK